MGSSFAAFTELGIEIFDTDAESVSQNSKLVIRTTPNRMIQDAVVNPDDEGKLLVTWNDEVESKFAAVLLILSDSNEILIGTESAPISSGEFSIEELPERNVVLNNVSADILKSAIEKSLSGSKYLDKSAAKIIRLCSENDDESNIKAVVQDLSDAAVVNLFAIISDEVSSKASRTPVLALWLKWLLLAHGGTLVGAGESVERLKSLQQGLNTGLKLLPKLLALQGRLSMLKQQQHLRDAVEEDEDIENNDEAEAVEDSMIVDHSVQEESIIFANGENDEDITIAEE